MNRDEYRERDESNIIHRNAGCYYPVDKKSGGTWFGFNQHGTVMALLNRYQDKNGDAKTSRGTIIPQLLRCKNSQQIHKSFNQLTLVEFDPFDLVVKTHNKIIKYSWDNKNILLLQQSVKQPFFLTSSSLNANYILPLRKEIFDRFLTKQTSIDGKHILTKLHLDKESTDRSSNIFMAREDTHTKSVSQVVIEGHTLNYKYLTEQQLSIMTSNTIHLGKLNLQVKLIISCANEV